MKLRCVHLLTDPDSERERRSIAEVSQLAVFGAEYIQIVNPVYEGELPPERKCNDRPFILTKAHLGCVLAHRQAIAQLTPELDALGIFECDCVFVEPPEPIYQRIERAVQACNEGNLDVFTMGYRHNGKTIDRVGSDVIVITQLIETHALILPSKSKALADELFDLKDWDCADYLWTVKGYDQRKIRIGTFADRPVAVQAVGVSLIDRRMKASEDHFRAVRYK